MKYYLAIDLGASSGRHIVGYKENGKIRTVEVHRFSNGMLDSSDGLIWDTDALFLEIKTGIKKAIEQFGRIESLSIDTWGVDYVLMSNNQDIKPHFAYRNSRIEKRIDEVHSVIPFEELYSRTGIQFASFNTVYQLYDDLKKGRLENATHFLMIPQYFTYLLTGKMMYEYTSQSTTGLLNAKTGKFDEEIINKLGFPKDIFHEIKQPGYEVGNLKGSIAEEVGGQMKVVLCASHDTASAFEAVNCPNDAIILSSGTWSLIGVKMPTPLMDRNSYESNFTNEGGVGYIRYLKNIMGMWISNQARKYSQLNSCQDIAAQIDHSSYEGYFDVNDSSLAAPSNMKTAIYKLLEKNPPKDEIDMYAAIYRSLAMSYEIAVEQIETNLNKTFSSIYIVGGGANNKYLNKLTEEITGKHVLAMPIEATAIGNLLIQMKE